LLNSQRGKSLKVKGQEVLLKMPLPVGKKGGRIAKNARAELEEQTGKSVVTEENFLPPPRTNKALKE